MFTAGREVEISIFLKKKKKLIRFKELEVAALLRHLVGSQMVCLGSQVCEHKAQTLGALTRHPCKSQLDLILGSSLVDGAHSRMEPISICKYVKERRERRGSASQISVAEPLPQRHSSAASVRGRRWRWRSSRATLIVTLGHLPKQRQR